MSRFTPAKFQAARKLFAPKRKKKELKIIRCGEGNVRGNLF
jgi:hypothetical protein